MPITPFHFGPGAALHAVAPRHVSFLAFCAANVVIDVESLINLVQRREPVHAFLHTYLGATLVWLGLAALWWAAQRLMRWRGLTLRQVALGALLGAYSHVLLDSVMHHDIQPLMPFATGNALQGVVSLSALHWACIASAVFAVMWLGLRRLPRFTKPSVATPIAVPSPLKAPIEGVRQLLEAHGLRCDVHEDWLLPRGQLPAIAAVWHPRETGGQLDVQVLVRQGVLIEECFAGFETGEAALSNALENFSRSSLHVLLAAFWNEVEPEQVTIEPWRVGGRPYTAFIGNFATRASKGIEPHCPDGIFQDLADAIQGEPLAEDVHWYRFYVGNVSGQLTLESLKDNQHWEPGLRCLQSQAWMTKNGFYSLRLFVVLRRVPADAS